MPKSWFFLVLPVMAVGLDLTAFKGNALAQTEETKACLKKWETAVQQSRSMECKFRLTIDDANSKEQKKFACVTKTLSLGGPGKEWDHAEVRMDMADQNKKIKQYFYTKEKSYMFNFQKKEFGTLPLFKENKTDTSFCFEEIFLESDFACQRFFISNDLCKNFLNKSRYIKEDAWYLYFYFDTKSTHQNSLFLENTRVVLFKESGLPRQISFQILSNFYTIDIEDLRYTNNLAPGDFSTLPEKLPEGWSDYLQKGLRFVNETNQDGEASNAAPITGNPPESNTRPEFTCQRKPLQKLFLNRLRTKWNAPTI